MIQRNETLQKEIGNIIRHLMQLRGISQGKLAKLSGVSQETICMNLKGERGWSIDVLNPICKALFITIGELLQTAEKGEEGWREKEEAMLTSARNYVIAEYLVAPLLPKRGEKRDKTAISVTEILSRITGIPLATLEEEIEARLWSEKSLMRFCMAMRMPREELEWHAKAIISGYFPKRNEVIGAMLAFNSPGVWLKSKHAEKQRAEIAEEKAQLEARWMELRKMEEELE